MIDTSVESEPLSAKELALWLLQQFTPDGAVINLAVGVRFPGGVRPAVLQAAIDRLGRRHPALRTVYPERGGAPARIVLPPEKTPRVLTEHVANEPIDAVLGRLAFAPIYIRDELPLRVHHVIHANTSIVLLVMNHVAVDRVSVRVILRELVEIYLALAEGADVPVELTGEAPRYVEPPVSEDDLAYWRRHLGDKLGGGMPALAYGRVVHRQSHSGAVLEHRLSAGANDAVTNVAAALRATRSMVLLAAYAMILSRHGAGPDIVIGLPVDVRDRRQRQIVGYHINVLPIRIDLRGAADFPDLVRQTRDAFLAGLRHSRAGVDDICPGAFEGVGVDRRQPLLRHMYNFFDLRRNDWTAPAGVEVVDVERTTSRVDLELAVDDQDSGALLRATYSDQLYERPDIEALLLRLEVLLERAGADPTTPLKQLSVLTDDERAVVTSVAVPGDLADAGEPDDARLAVFDADGLEVPPGVFGTLHVAGAGWARSTTVVGRVRSDGGIERFADPSTPDDPVEARDQALVDYLCGLWQRALGLPTVDADGHFFRLGGTSLMAARLIVEVRKTVSLKLTLRDVLKSPTPAKLAATIARLPHRPVDR